MKRPYRFRLADLPVGIPYPIWLTEDESKVYYASDWHRKQVALTRQRLIHQGWIIKPAPHPSNPSKAGRA